MNAEGELEKMIWNGREFIYPSHLAGQTIDDVNHTPKIYSLEKLPLFFYVLPLHLAGQRFPNRRAVTYSIQVIVCVVTKMHVRVTMITTSVARGGEGARGELPPIMLFRSFVGTCGNLLVHVSRQASRLYRQCIWSTNKMVERNSSFRIWKCETFLSSLTSASARIAYT